MKPTISAVIAARDEADVLGGCLKRLDFVDEIIVVVDDRTTDSTAEVARAAGAKVLTRKFTTFSDIKNFGIEAAGSDWILIIDGDERVPKTSAVKILKALGDDSINGYDLPWENYFLGRKMEWGGWQETHIRLFQKRAARYDGDIHETLKFTADTPVIKALNAPIAHFSHRSIIHNLQKTATNATIQAQEMLDKGWPKVRARTFFGVMGRELYYRLILKRGYRDGIQGVIESVYQACSWFVIYTRLWELQQKPSLEERYSKLEEEIDG